MNKLIDILLSSKGAVPFIACAVLFVVITFLNPTHTTVECVSRDQYCVITSKFLGFNETNNTLKPESISKTTVSEYYKREYSVRHGKKKRHNYQRYKLYAVDSSGNSSLLLDNISTKYEAEELGADLLTCINAQNYPCKISR